MMMGMNCVNNSANDRDCSHCIWHTSGQCANWNCEPVSRKEALEALEKVKELEAKERKNDADRESKTGKGECRQRPADDRQDAGRR